MKLDSPEAIEQAKQMLAMVHSATFDRPHGKPYKAPKQKDPCPRFANTPEDEAKAMRKLKKLLKPANGKIKQVRVHKEVKRSLLTKLKAIL